MIKTGTTVVDDVVASVAGTSMIVGVAMASFAKTSTLSKSGIPSPPRPVSIAIPEELSMILSGPLPPLRRATGVPSALRLSQTHGSHVSALQTHRDASSRRAKNTPDFLVIFSAVVATASVGATVVPTSVAIMSLPTDGMKPVFGGFYSSKCLRRLCSVASWPKPYSKYSSTFP